MVLLPLVLGIMYIILSILLLILNGLLIVALNMDKECKHNNTYRIMSISCFSYFLQSITFLAGGIMTIAQSTFSSVLDRVLGAIVASGWYLSIATSFTLAVDRLLMFAFPQSSYSSIIRRAVMALCWLIWLVTLVAMCLLPGLGYTYNRDGVYYIWALTHGSASAVVEHVEPFCDMTIFLIIFVMYTIVCGCLIKLKRSSSDQCRSFKAELRIFAAAVISFFYETIFVSLCFWMPPNLLGFEFTYIFLSLAWMVECGMFASLTLTMNTTLRRKVQRKLGLNRQSAVFIIGL
uniref:G_PROTEIN_RECEP_F1_2 domain-containing protein n=1 Tax=Steinernema glaseri TaxID=37863 RepID=A0A1I7Z7W7_9BILA